MTHEGWVSDSNIGDTSGQMITFVRFIFNFSCNMDGFPVSVNKMKSEKHPHNKTVIYF